MYNRNPQMWVTSIRPSFKTAKSFSENTQKATYDDVYRAYRACQWLLDLLDLYRNELIDLPFNGPVEKGMVTDAPGHCEEKYIKLIEACEAKFKDQYAAYMDSIKSIYASEHEKLIAEIESTRTALKAPKVNKLYDYLHLPLKIKQSDRRTTFVEKVKRSYDTVRTFKKLNQEQGIDLGLYHLYLYDAYQACQWLRGLVELNTKDLVTMLQHTEMEPRRPNSAFYFDATSDWEYVNPTAACIAMVEKCEEIFQQHDAATINAIYNKFDDEQLEQLSKPTEMSNDAETIDWETRGERLAFVSKVKPIYDIAKAFCKVNREQETAISYADLYKAYQACQGLRELLELNAKGLLPGSLVTASESSETVWENLVARAFKTPLQICVELIKECEKIFRRQDVAKMNAIRHIFDDEKLEKLFIVDSTKVWMRESNKYVAYINSPFEITAADRIALLALRNQEKPNNPKYKPNYPANPVTLFQPIKALPVSDTAENQLRLSG